jgi:hypothetical protein
MENISSALMARIDSADVIVFEGFEMTGKSTLAKQIANSYPPLDTMIYRPDWESAMNDKVVSRGNRYIPGLTTIDFFKSIKSRSPLTYPGKLLLDRWMAVAYVYQKAYNQVSDNTDMDHLIKSHVDVAKGLDIIFLHKKHLSKEEAREMYNITMSTSSEHEDIYDRFNGFEDYYRHYCKFESLYDEFYSLIPFDVYKISSLTNKLEEV